MTGRVAAVIVALSVLAVLVAACDSGRPSCIGVACRISKSSPTTHRPNPFIQIVPERTTT